jgi:2-dehydro-3-deoxyphosphooctonate aldolase (KDO 8-P synthase)
MSNAKQFLSSIGTKPFFIAGPCVIESEELCLSIGRRLADLARRHDVAIIFKSSYDKANRTSASSFRGVGMDEGLRILDKVGKETGLPLLTDIHLPLEAAIAAEVVDVLQIPAFLCRQTDLLVSARETGKHVNIKKGQFMAPDDMRYAAEKVGSRALVTERGTFFGYHQLVVDFPGLTTMKSIGVPVIFDATHSVQLPGGCGGTSGGNRALAFPMASAAVAFGVDGVFFEVHPDPDRALCDGPNSIRLDDFEHYVPRLVEMYQRHAEWRQ